MNCAHNKKENDLFQCSAYVYIHKGNVLVEHSNGNCGSLHEGCCAPQVLQATKKLPSHRSLHWRELTPEVAV